MEKIYQASTAEGAIDFINMRDLEIAAEEVIPKGGYGYISSGAGDIFTYQENERAFNHKLIIPHVLKDIELPDTTLSFGGDTLSAPIIMGPRLSKCCGRTSVSQRCFTFWHDLYGEFVCLLYVGRNPSSWWPRSAAVVPILYE